MVRDHVVSRAYNTCAYNTCAYNTCAYIVYIRGGIRAEHGGYDRALDSPRDEQSIHQSLGSRLIVRGPLEFPWAHVQNPTSSIIFQY
jgi:hypothetical protein